MLGAPKKGTIIYRSDHSAGMRPKTHGQSSGVGNASYVSSARSPVAFHHRPPGHMSPETLNLASLPLSLSPSLSPSRSRSHSLSHVT